MFWKYYEGLLGFSRWIFEENIKAVVNELSITVKCDNNINKVAFNKIYEEKRRKFIGFQSIQKLVRLFHIFRSHAYISTITTTKVK